MSLRDLVPEIVVYVQENAGRVEYASRLNKVDAGQLLPEIEIALKREYSTKTVSKMIGRIPCINLLTRIVDKKSKIYGEPVTRFSDNERDTELVEFYKKKMNLDAKMGWSNRLYNLHEHCAVEPYLDRKGKPSLRALSPNQFLMYSTDDTDPTSPTVFIKFMGDAERVRQEEHVDSNGVYTDASEDAKVDVLYLYTDNEFMVVDSEGEIRDDLTPEGSESGINPLGMLPVIYINQSNDRLLPLPNTDILNNTTLIPMLLGDLNFAVKYLSHSLFIAKDLKLNDDIEVNPDAIIQVETVPDATDGSFEVVTPKIDIDAVLRLVQTILATWLESLGIRPGSMGNATGSSRTSALSKMVDESDTVAIRNDQVNKFSDIEKELFQLIKAYHESVWRRSPGFEETKSFSKDFELGIMFPEQKIFSSEKEKIEKAEMMKGAGLATPRQAVRSIYPSMTEAELDKYMEELDEFTRKQIQIDNAEQAKEDKEPKESEPPRSGDS